jgi:hypothetical protein
MKAEEVHARLYQEAQDTGPDGRGFLLSLPLSGNIEKVLPRNAAVCGVPGDRFISTDALHHLNLYHFVPACPCIFPRPDGEI